MEPDTLLRRSWEGALRGRGHVVTGTGQVDAALILTESFHPDVIVWDMGDMAPNGDLEKLRHKTDAYILVVSQHLSPDRRVGALAAGADAVMCLPCHANELLAQTSALLRRPRTVTVAPPVTTSRRRFGPLDIDTARREAAVNGRRLPLTRIEFDLLAHLCNHPHEVVGREELVSSVWGPEWNKDTHMVDVHISNLRRKLDQSAPGIPAVQTVRGMGFRLASELLEAPSV
jgi:two-component system OmpR family response regulator